jgi:thiosulfate/3-mercaptopyruvate sulfurtransferase
MQRAEKRLRTPLISTQELAGHLSDAAWFVADCRFELGKPEAGRAAWEAGHIPGAAHVDLERHLSTPVTPQTGRHPLPSPQSFAATLSRLGIGNDSKVVCYDGGSGAFAARLWWMLRWVGHDAVAVLDGGFAAWTAEGRPVSTERAERAAAAFVPRLRSGMVVDAEQVVRALARGEVLVDLRGAERFEGHVQPAVRREPRRGRPLPRCRGSSGALAVAGGRARGPRADLHVRVRRHRLPGPARARGCRHPGRPALCRLLE